MQFEDFEKLYEGNKADERKRQALNEGATPTTLKIGTKMTADDGTELVIKGIEVTRFHLRNPTTRITYTYKTPDGKTGTESNDVDTVQKMLIG